MPKIPFAVTLPSLVVLQSRASVQRPHAAPEWIHAIAILAQCAYEDYEQWINTQIGPMPVNPNDFHSTDVLGLAKAYMASDDGKPA